MTRDPEWSLVDRYVAGEATADDLRALHAWTAEDPTRVVWLDALRAHATAADARRDVDAAWSRVASRTVQAPTTRRTLTVERGTAARSTWSARAPWIARAAAAVVLVVAGVGLWRTSSRPARRAAPVTAMRELVAPRGGRADIRLADGTRVALNAGSKLRYAASYGRASVREMWLDGEGYFEVRHDATRPFRVHAGGGVAEDLGTRFVVRAYPELARVEVMVAEGRVALRHDVPGLGARADSAVLGPGQLGRLSGDALTVSSAVGEERYLAWTTGALVLDDVPLRDALPLLERRYDLSITLADSALGSRRVVARFRDQPADEVLGAIALALGARVERHGRDVTLRASTAH